MWKGRLDVVYAYYRHDLGQMAGGRRRRGFVVESVGMPAKWTVMRRPHSDRFTERRRLYNKTTLARAEESPGQTTILFVCLVQRFKQICYIFMATESLSLHPIQWLEGRHRKALR